VSHSSPHVAWLWLATSPDGDKDVRNKNRAAHKVSAPPFRPPAVRSANPLLFAELSGSAWATAEGRTRPPFTTALVPTTGSMGIKREPANQQQGSAQNEAPGGLTAQSSTRKDSPSRQRAINDRGLIVAPPGRCGGVGG
jgi:hypothetical protein